MCSCVSNEIRHSKGKQHSLIVNMGCKAQLNMVFITLQISMNVYFMRHVTLRQPAPIQMVATHVSVILATVAMGVYA